MPNGFCHVFKYSCYFHYILYEDQSCYRSRIGIVSLAEKQVLGE